MIKYFGVFQKTLKFCIETLIDFNDKNKTAANTAYKP